MRLKRGKRLAIVSASVLFLAAIPNNAYADNFSGATGTNGLGCMPDDNIVTDNKHWYVFYSSSVPQAMRTILDATLGSDFANVGLNVNYGTNGSTANSDMNAYWDDYLDHCGYDWNDADGPGALARCMSLNASNECEQHRIYFDQPSMTTSTLRNWYACHELGHTVGLRHKTLPYTGSSCMHIEPNSNLTDHDRDHISNWGGYA